MQFLSDLVGHFTGLKITFYRFKMDILREKQLTLRASRRPVEYNYTNADIHHQDTNAHDGYQFEYPVNWAGDPSTNKVIGIRRINYKPVSIDFAVQFAIREGSGNIITINVVNVFTDQNTFEECITRIVTELNVELANHEPGYKCIVAYNKDTGDFTMKFDGGADFMDWSIGFFLGNDNGYDRTEAAFNNDMYTHYKRNFAYLFNQEFTKELCDELHSYHNNWFRQLVFKNVWNRDNFYCHASFSDSPKQIIGINHDFWPTPSVFYEHSDNSNDFNIYFTTDTVHRILPRNGVMLIQLSYVFNYQNSMLTYA